MIFLGEHWFESAASIQARFGPIVVRPDGIKDDRKARQYIAQVVGMLRGLEATKTGSAVITTIRFHNKPVIIFPYDGQGGHCNEWAKRDWGLFVGSVSFTPFLYGDQSKCVKRSGRYKAARSPFEFLVHELTHIVRAVSGHWRDLEEDDEEELAAMVTDIFSSETHRAPIRDYITAEKVTGDLAVFSRAYYDEQNEMIAAFCKQNSNLALKLARVKTPFNPILQYFNEVRPPEWSGQ
jgi:hypothetical protein